MSSKDFLRLPLEHEIELYINVYLGTDLISILPYFMAPMEFKELKVQL